jgi:pimeloyl-ACP methyl ester carboxylesterase
MTTDSSLPDHTIYAPITPPKNVSMPFIAWGNGGCSADGAGYKNFLVEIASHGYVIAADGPPGGRSGQTMVEVMKKSLDWAEGGGAKKYGDVDINRIVTAGHSCGGLEAMSTAYHDARVKRVMLFNIAIFQDERRYLLQEIKIPVAWFVGGPQDMGYPNVSFHPFPFPLSPSTLLSLLHFHHLPFLFMLDGR